LLVTSAVTVLVIGALLGVRGRGLVTATIVVVCFGVTLSYVAQRFPLLAFGSTLATLRQDPTFYASKRLNTANAVVNLYTDHPSFILTGSGPGTFSSRAWQTFAFVKSKSGSNVQGKYVKALTGGQAYHTDVSDKYVVPLQNGPVIEGSKAVTSPFSSYTSLLAEVGVAGFLLIVGVYLTATGRVSRVTFRTIHSAAPGDPLPALLVATSVAFLVLLQMGILENWLEVTRVTFPAWLLLGVTTRELAQRGDAA
jgi:hypothetical protein